MPLRTQTIGLRWASLLLLFSCGGGGEREELACHLAGCFDTLVLTLRTRDEMWPAGHYVFELEFDDEQHTCAVDMPVRVPSGPSVDASLPCEPQLNASFNPPLICSEERVAGGEITQHCTPVRDRWTLKVHKPGTPALLQLRVTRDATPIFETSERLEYEANRPNGPGCEPVCELGELDLRLE